MKCPGRVVVVSADGGAGHGTAAAELTRRLRGRGFEVDRINLLEVLPRPVHRAVAGAYPRVHRWLPWAYAALVALTGRSPLSVSLLRGLLRPLRHRMRRAIPVDTRAVATTCPFSTQLLGPLRRRGRLVVPVITYVTDLVVHPLWLSPGVDVYCAVRHAELPPWADRVDVAVVQPLLPALDGLAARRTGPTAGEPSPALDPAEILADAANGPARAGVHHPRRRPLVDTFGDAVAVVAALLQTCGRGSGSR